MSRRDDKRQSKKSILADIATAQTILLKEVSRLPSSSEEGGLDDEDESQGRGSATAASANASRSYEPQRNVGPSRADSHSRSRNSVPAPAPAPARPRAPSNMSDDDGNLPSRAPVADRSLSVINEHEEHEEQDNDPSTVQRSSSALAHVTKKRDASQSSRRSLSKPNAVIVPAVKASVKAPVKASASTSSHYNPNPNPSERGVSPSVLGPSKGWYRNQNGPADLGRPTPAQINETEEKQVIMSVQESMNETQMHKAFKIRLTSMTKRDDLYFANAANSFVGAKVIFRNNPVTFPLSSEFRKKLTVFQKIKAEMAVLLRYPRSALVNILIVAKKEGILTETWRAEQWLHDNLNTVWENIDFCSKFTEHGVPALHPYVIGKCLLKQEKEDENKLDLDFLPLSDVGVAELETNLRNIKNSILELNRHIASVRKTPEPVEDQSLFDIIATKKLASNADGLVNSVLSTFGSKKKKEGEIEALVHGFTTKFIATASVSAVLLVITGAFVVDRNEFVRTELIKLFTSEGFKRTLGSAFSIGCSQEIATFIGEIAQRTGKTLNLTEKQIEYVYESITNAITDIRGVKPVAKGNIELAFNNFAEWGYYVEQGAVKSRALERARSASAHELWSKVDAHYPGSMRAASEDARFGVLSRMLESDDDMDEDEEENYDADEDMDEDEEEDEDTDEDDGNAKPRKGGKRTTKRSKVTKKRKQKKRKTVKRKRRATKKK